MTDTTRRAFVRTTAATTVFGATTAAGVGTVAAVPPEEGSGTGTIDQFQIVPVREVGGNTFEDRVLTGSVRGTLDGTFVQETSGMVHKDGRVVFRGSMTFDGELEGCGSGTLHLRLSGRGEVLEPGFPVTEGSVRVVNQAENTIDVTGTGTVVQEGRDLAYEIQYNCR